MDGFSDSEGGSRSNRLELMSDHLQNGIVYDVSQRLEDIQELISDPNIHLRRPSAPTLLNSVLVKNKRLGSVSSHVKLRNENGKKKTSKQSNSKTWFIKKLTFSKRSTNRKSKETSSVFGAGAEERGEEKKEEKQRP